MYRWKNELQEVHTFFQEATQRCKTAHFGHHRQCTVSPQQSDAEIYREAERDYSGVYSAILAGIESR